MDGSLDYIAELTPLGPIGEGVFGEVHRYLDPVHGEVAVKRFFRSKFGSDEAWREACAGALKEARSLKTLEHENVVKIHQVLKSPLADQFLIVMEYCEGKSVRQLTEKNVISLPEAKGIIRDAAIGLNYIHGSKYLHRDIKPDNILLKASGRAKLGDFGFVTDDLQFGFATPYGTAIYWAPEVLGERACSELSDVYSLGVTFLNLVSGDLWFLRDGKGCLLEAGDDGEPHLKSKMLLLPHIPTTWRNTIAKLCRREPANRCQSLASAVNSIARLPAVEPWSCTVDDDIVRWELTKGKRRVRVEWINYLGRHDEHWGAWSEDLAGGGRRTIATNRKDDQWKAIYSSLQAFFANRTVR
ncbi:serine/threonine protein kinase (plasmid) [Rhizobium ruizarguesonis]|uniref:serine/threonine-protein kinase n=1 Tax=Rhizobium ruizarguesonis TaxID=2081791 RepID=UPI0010306F3B|nr:serine/threonine-protein kinase [Rhizobium ruizarguesonis]TBB58959.1 serine/threonine protein kinase [Rhizobium ruizarguesonis]